MLTEVGVLLVISLPKLAKTLLLLPLLVLAPKSFSDSVELMQLSLGAHTHIQSYSN